jgi:hypothetical protein
MLVILQPKRQRLGSDTMAGFKDYLESDMSVFYNSSEFGEEHTINDRTLVIVPLDGEELKKHIKYLGLTSDTIAYSVQASAYGKPPKMNEYQSYDGKDMLVTDIKIDAGEYLITLSGNE